MILTNTVAVMKRLGRAAMKSDRSPEDIEFVASIDDVPLSAIKDAADVSFRFFGLTPMEGARGKIMQFREIEKTEKYEGVQWHLTGPLHMKDVREAVSLFHLIQTVDSAVLAEEISRQAKAAGKLQRILLQVSMADGAPGIPEEKCLAVFETARKLKGLKIEGLATVVPFGENIEEGRLFYRRLFELRSKAEEEGHVLPHLSMGGNQDFEVAIEEGATLVRIDAVVFGESVC